MTSVGNSLMLRSHVASSSSGRFMRSSMTSKGLMQSSHAYDPALAVLMRLSFSIHTARCSTRVARSGRLINVRRNWTDVGYELVLLERCGSATSVWSTSWATTRSRLHTKARRRRACTSRLYSLRSIMAADYELTAERWSANPGGS